MSTIHSRPTSAESPRAVEPGAPGWPAWAPEWASRASVAHREVEFERRWTIPSAFRDGDPFNVVTVRQAFAEGADGTYLASDPRVEAGPDGLWADHRAEEIAKVLRAIADALDSQIGALPRDDGSAR